MINKRLSFILLAIFIFNFFSILYAATSDIPLQEDLRKMEPKFVKHEKRILLSSYYDYGWVKLNSQDQKWANLGNYLAYFYNGINPIYFNVNRYSRRSVVNYTYDLGGYFKFDRSYANLEFGFGQYVTYAYKFKFLGEFTHPLIGNLHLKERYKFLHNRTENINIVSPGLIYYFGNHYITMYYNAGITDKRGTGHWGELKVNLNLLQNLDFWLGTAIGQRLYDITGGPKAHDQNGYIIFSGFKYSFTKDLSVYLNFLYGKESKHNQLKFNQRSLEAGFSYRF